MPRPLDLHERRDEILAASMELLARGGSRALTIKAIATELGGSTTLVTHVFGRKDEIYDAIIERLGGEIRQRVAPFDEVEPRTALREFLLWCVPFEHSELDEERLRFAFLERAGSDQRMQVIVDQLDARMREELVARLRPLVFEGSLREQTDYLRAITNGAILSMVERPGDWSQERIIAVIDQAISSLEFMRS